MTKGVCSDPIRNAELKRMRSERITGTKHPMYGRHHSEATRKKISSSCTNPSEETRKKMRDARKLQVITQETKIKMSVAQTGSKNHFYKKRHTEETKQKLSKALRGKIPSLETLQKQQDKKLGKIHTEKTKMKMCEGHLGGFWYGNVRYGYHIDCELWKDVNPRVHAWFDYKCVLCEEMENGHSHIGHHVFYETKACCMTSEDGQYYTNLNAKNHPIKDYYIGENPNYFVILCRSCHGKTGGSFENRKKYADELREMIDTYYEGKCYYTKEEWEKILLANH